VKPKGLVDPESSTNLILYAYGGRKIHSPHWQEGILVLTESVLLFLRAPEPYLVVDWAIDVTKIRRVSIEKDGVLWRKHQLLILGQNDTHTVFRVSYRADLESIAQAIRNQIPHSPRKPVRIPIQPPAPFVLNPIIIKYALRNHHPELRKVIVEWSSDPTTIYRGQLILTDEFLFFQTGRMANTIIRWITELKNVRTIALERANRQEQDQQIAVHITTRPLEVFQILPGNGVDGLHLVQQIRHAIQRITKTPSPVSRQDPIHPDQYGSSHLSLETLILNTITAYRAAPVISFEQILELCQSRLGVSLQDVKTRLAQLISNQRLPGYLSNEGYVQDVHLTIECQTCDQQVLNPLEFWQCPQCFRYLCATCRPQHHICPTHPESSTILVKMPHICPECHAPIGNLAHLAAYQCPYCQEPVIPPVVNRP
jgi:hypothetical protein